MVRGQEPPLPLKLFLCYYAIKNNHVQAIILQSIIVEPFEERLDGVTDSLNAYVKAHHTLVGILYG